MSDITKRCFSLNLTILRLLGLYPREDHSVLYLVYGYALLVCCSLSDPILSCLYYLKHEELSVLDAGINLFALIAQVINFPRVILFIKNNKSIRECIYYVETSMPVRPNERQKPIVEDYVWVCRRNSTFFVTCVIFDTVSWSARPLLFSKKEFPMDVWLPFDPTTNTLLFYIIYVFVGMGMVYVGVVCGAVDPLIAGLAYLGAGQIKILKNNLQSLWEDVGGDKEIIYAEIQKCIQHHHSIIRYINKFEECFSWPILYQFIGSTVLIGLSCLELSKMETVTINSFLVTIYFLSATVEVYFYCYYGTTIYEESKDLITAAYMGPWYKYDLKSKKALVTFMERAKIPMSVTVGKVFSLTLGTFTQILKKSYSVLAVLRNY